MYEIKTKENNNSVNEFIEKSADNRKADINIIMNIMKKISGDNPKMWGDSIIGFGKYQYKYATGHTGEAPKLGLSPRKQNLTIYLTIDIEGEHELFSKLGKYKNGKGCLYIKKITDINENILEQILIKSYNSIN